MKTIPLNARSKAILTRIGTKKTFSPAQTIYWQQDFGNTFFTFKKAGSGLFFFTQAARSSRMKSLAKAGLSA